MRGLGFLLAVVCLAAVADTAYGWLCPAGQLYSRWDSPCRPTCQNLNAPAFCGLPFRAVCICPFRQVFQNGRCVPVQNCVCNPNPCRNGGRCVVNPWTRAGYQCVCPWPFGGVNCWWRQIIIWVRGDPHYTTLDGLWIPYQGPNKYIIVKSRDDANLTEFAVLTKNEPQTPGSDFTVIKYVEIRVGGDRIRLGPGSEIKIDGEVLNPDIVRDMYTITRNGLRMRFEGNSNKLGFDLIVQYDGKSGVAVTLSDQAKGKIEGIMGNFDGNKDNDLVTRNGTVVADTDPNRFNLIGNSWEVIDDEVIRSPNPTQAGDPGCSNTTRALGMSNEYCGLLQAGSVFDACRTSGEVEINDEQCMFDVCAYADNLDKAKELACDHLSTAADECNEKGYQVKGWRDLANCPYDCPPGRVYKATMKACQASCAFPYAEIDCTLPDTEGCACPDDTVLDEGECVSSCGGKPIKKSACVYVAVDVSESIEADAHKKQEAELLGNIWDSLVTTERLEKVNLVVTLLPFDEGVIEDEIRVITSETYNTTDTFITEELKTWRLIQEEIKAKDTEGLTDISAVLDFVVGQCDESYKAFIILSDFIVTKNPLKLTGSIDDLRKAGFKAFAIGLDKERNDDTFSKLEQVSDLSIDTKLEYSAQDFNHAMEGLVPIS